METSTYEEQLKSLLDRQAQFLGYEIKMEDPNTLIVCEEDMGTVYTHATIELNKDGTWTLTARLGSNFGEIINLLTKRHMEETIKHISNIKSNYGANK